MKMKIVGICICMLMVAATVLPAAETINKGQPTPVEKNILSTESTESETGQSGMLTNDYDWEIIGNNVVTGHGGSYPPGNVGIGTTSPEAGLHIKGNTPMIKLEETDQGNKKWHLAGYNSGLSFAESNVADRLYLAAGGNVGIGTITPGAMLDVEMSSGPAATIGSYQNIATGQMSIALGDHTTASGDFSTAMGYGATASGMRSIAMGWDTQATGKDSTAMGSGTKANGHGSTAIGCGINVDGYLSVGIGLNDQGKPPVTADNVLVIMGGNVGINTTAPSYLLDIAGGNNIVAQFSGRVKGAKAVNDDEFVTKAQADEIVSEKLQSILQLLSSPLGTNFINQNIVDQSSSNLFESAMKIRYTPTGTNDNTGNIGDVTFDDSYLYVKTDEGWKRAALEIW